MIKVFETNEEFVSFMVTLPTHVGEIFCTNYLPSSLFPKDTISLYFERIDPEERHNLITSQLWQHGKHQLQAYLKGQATLCIEIGTLHALCFTGKIHEQLPQFEVSYSVRVYVLEVLSRVVQAQSLIVTREPIPYIFRLCPPSGVLLDVARNVARQKVQGIWIDDLNAYGSFAKEFERLKAEAASINDETLDAQIKTAIERLKSGESYRWSER